MSDALICCTNAEGSQWLASRCAIERLHDDPALRRAIGIGA